MLQSERVVVLGSVGGCHTESYITFVWKSFLIPLVALWRLSEYDYMSTCLSEPQTGVFERG